MLSCNSLPSAWRIVSILVIQRLDCIDSKMFHTLNQLALSQRADAIGVACSQQHPQTTLPFDRHNTLTLFSLDELVMPTNVGPKNMTSSSGCAMTSRMLRPYRGRHGVRFSACILRSARAASRDYYHDTQNSTSKMESSEKECRPIIVAVRSAHTLKKSATHITPGFGLDGRH